MIKIINIHTNIKYNIYSIRFHAAGNNIKGFLDISGDNGSPPDGKYLLPDFNDTLIQIESYDQIIENLEIDYHKDNTLECFIVIPVSNQS